MSIQAFLENPYQVKQIILYLYSKQTDTEQSSSVTVESNGKGFNAVDAPIMSSFSKQILAGRGLSEKQLATARLILPKYSKQLSEMEWQSVSIPSIGQQPVTVPPSEEEERLGKNGSLKINSRGALCFYPKIYPSKQIKNIGFSYWENGAWHQNKPMITREVIEDVKKMFGEIYIDFEIAKVLSVPSVTLPDELQNHPSLYPYQIDTIKFQLSHPHSLISLAPRLGKTVTTTLAAKTAGCKKILVVTLLSLLQDWKNKIMFWSPEEVPSIVYKNQLPVGSKWTITNFDTVRRHMSTFTNEDYDCIIIDESLMIKNRKASRTKAIKQLVESNNPKYCWLLSGAPTSKYYDDLWAQVNILAPKRFSSYWKFADRYCQIQPNQWSKFNLVGNKPDAAKAIKHDLQDIMFARSAQDVTDLPPFNPENIFIPMSSSQEKIYNQMESDFVATLDSEGTKLLAPNVISQFIRLLQLASNPLLVDSKDDSNKWDAIPEWMEISEKPVIVWTSFIKTAELLHERLSKTYKVSKLTGQTKQSDRSEIVKRFQDYDLDVLIAHPAVGKYGLDLFNAGTVIYLERGMNPDDYYQSLNRTRKVGQTSFARIVHFISRKKDGGETVDDVIDKLLLTRVGDTTKLTTAGLKNMFAKETTSEKQI